MGKHINGKALRTKRAGRNLHAKELRDVHSRLEGKPNRFPGAYAHPLQSSSMTAVAGEAAKYYDGAAIEEMPETHIVPRRSITAQQMLKHFPVPMETEPIKGRQMLAKPIRNSRSLEIVVPAGTMVEVNDNRLTWKGDKNLLHTHNPFRMGTDFKRQGAIAQGLNKRVIVEGGAKQNPVAEDTFTGVPALAKDAVMLEPDAPIYRCETCGKQCKHKEHLHMHIRINHAIR